MQEFFKDKNKNFLEPALYVLATPIGNTGDITIRGLETLQQTEIIFCEDTRITKNLLNLYDIHNKKFYTYNNYSTDDERKRIIQLVQDGNPVVLVSDAGTPLISDPGFKLVKMCNQNNIRIIPVGGISASITALSSAGISSDKFIFYGFLSPKIKEKEKELSQILSNEYSTICYETSNRLIDTLKIINKIDSERTICVARELTKKFEDIKTDTCSNILQYYTQNNDKLKGEIVLIIEKTEKSKKLDFDNLDSILKASLEYLSVKDSSELLSKIYGINKKELYNKLLTINGK